MLNTTMLFKGPFLGKEKERMPFCDAHAIHGRYTDQLKI